MCQCLFKKNSVVQSWYRRGYTGRVRCLWCYRVKSPEELGLCCSPTGNFQVILNFHIYLDMFRQRKRVGQLTESRRSVHLCLAWSSICLMVWTAPRTSDPEEKVNLSLVSLKCLEFVSKASWESETQITKLLYAQDDLSFLPICLA